MIIERTKNASRNIIFGSILKLYQIALPFALRTIMMYTIGVKYLGLNSLFTSILQVLNLAELGVGSAMVFSMYKPIADDDSDTICALMQLYKIYYRMIGLIILIVGLVILPFVPNLIASDAPEDINVYILYLLNLAATVLTYWLFAYKNSILQAHQRTDVSSKVTIVTDTIKYALQIAALFLLKNYYLYVIILLATQALNNIITAILAQKIYPQYNAKGKLPVEKVKSINQKIKDLFTSKLGYTLVTAADNLVISSFLGLAALAKYQNYYFIMSSVIGFVAIIYSSITAGVGNSMLTKSIEKNYEEFKVFTLLVAYLSAVCVSCFLVLYQPFMKIWMGDDMLLSFAVVILFCIYFWVYELVMMISVYKDAGGIWHKDRFRPLVSGIINLMINLLVVKNLGVNGVKIATVVSMAFVSIPWIISNVFKEIFKISPIKYVKKLLFYTFDIVVVSSVAYYATIFISGASIFTLVLKAIVTVIVSVLVMLILVRKDESFEDAVKLVLKMLKIDRLLVRLKKG